MRSVLRNFMCGVGWDKKKHFPISRSTLPRWYLYATCCYVQYDNSSNYGKKNEVTESCPEFNAE